MNATGITVALMLLAVVDAGCRHAHAQPSPQITVSTPSAPDASPASPLGGEPMAPVARAHPLVRRGAGSTRRAWRTVREPPAAPPVPSTAAEATHRCEVNGVAYRCTRQEGFIVSFDLRPPYPMFRRAGADGIVRFDLLTHGHGASFRGRRSRGRSGSGRAACGVHARVGAHRIRGPGA